MHRAPRLALAAIALLLLLPSTARSGAGKGRRAAGLKPVTRGRAAGLKPVTRGRAAGLKPVTRGRAAGLKPVTRGRAAGLKPVTRGRAAGLKPVTRDRAAGLKPVTRGRAAGLRPITRGRAAGLRPVTRDRAAGLVPVTPGLSPVNADRAAALQPVNVDRAAGLVPVTRDRAAGLRPVTLDRVAGLPAVTLDREGVLSALSGDGGVVAFEDGYLAPYGARPLVTEGFFEQALSPSAPAPYGLSRADDRITERFGEEGLDLVVGQGSVDDVLDAIDPYGPHRYVRAPLGQNVPPGERVGHFYFPAAYYVRPLTRSTAPGSKGYRLILVPRDVVEEIPEDFEQTLRRTRFPVVIGDMAFKEGSYVQAALAFREAVDRRPGAVAPRFALGDALVALRNYARAAEMIRAGLAAAPRWADDLDRRGVYGRREDLETHQAELEGFLEEHPESGEAWFLLGYLRMTSGAEDVAEAAARAYRRALDLDPDDELSRRYLARLEGD